MNKNLKIKLLCLLIIVIICITIVIIIKLNNSKTCAVELSKNSSLSTEMIEKIAKITKSEEKVAYLTFDDGPSGNTDKILTILDQYGPKRCVDRILDMLESYGVKATFFVIGKYVDRHPEIVKREYEEGHYIANHGYDHNNSVLYKSNESFRNEVEKTDAAIGKAIGIDNYCSHIFRFPNGFMSPSNKARKKEVLKVLEEMQYTYVDWNCLNNDSVKKYSKQELLNNLKKTSRNKGSLVVLMHDTKDVSDSSTILRESIEYLKSEGYEFKNFYNLLED